MSKISFVFTKTKGLFIISEYVAIKDIQPHRIKLIDNKDFYEALLIITPITIYFYIAYNIYDFYETNMENRRLS